MKMINLSKLPLDKKRRCWEQIKQNNEPLAKMLAEDKGLKSLVETFNGDILVERNSINAQRK